MIKQMKIKNIIRRWLDKKELPKKFNYFGDVYELSSNYIKHRNVDLDNLYYNGYYNRYFEFTGYSDREETVIVECDILDEEEKIYLSSVIKPFRDKVENIKLQEYLGR